MNERRGGVHISCTAHPVSHRYAVLADLESELRSPRTPPGEGEGQRAPIQFSSSVHLPATPKHPSLANTSLTKQRAQGMPGVLCTRSLVCNKRNTRA
jgi:hypothetical protein